jgi:DHA1 family multidrug resistance protein-like MFS transporter
MAPDLLRDSTFGFFVNQFSRGRFLPYRDQRPDYAIPARYLSTAATSVTLCGDPSRTTEPDVVSLPPRQQDERTLVEEPGVCEARETLSTDVEKDERSSGENGERTVPPAYLVNWEGADDPDNPR